MTFLSENIDFINYLISLFNGLGSLEGYSLSGLIKSSTTALNCDSYKKMLEGVAKTYNSRIGEKIQNIELIQDHYKSQYISSIKDIDIESEKVFSFSEKDLLDSFNERKVCIYGNKKEALEIEEPYCVHIVPDDFLLNFLFFSTAQLFTTQGLFIAGNRQWHPNSFPQFLRNRFYGFCSLPESFFSIKKPMEAGKILSQYIAKLISKRKSPKQKLVVAIYAHGEKGVFQLTKKNKGDTWSSIIVDIPSFLYAFPFPMSGILFFGCRCFGGRLEEIFQAACYNDLSVAGAFFNRSFSGSFATWTSRNPREYFDPLSLMHEYQKLHFLPGYFDSMFYINRSLSVARKTDLIRKRRHKNQTYVFDEITTIISGIDTRFPNIHDFHRYHDISYADYLAIRRLQSNRALETTILAILQNAKKLNDSFNDVQAELSPNVFLDYLKQLGELLKDMVTDPLQHYLYAMIDAKGSATHQKHGVLWEVGSSSFVDLLKRIHIIHRRLILHRPLISCIISDKMLHPDSLIKAWVFIPFFTSGRPDLGQLFGNDKLKDEDYLIKWYYFSQHEFINSFTVIVADYIFLLNQAFQNGIFTTNEVEHKIKKLFSLKGNWSN